jgi:hypothetical protein
MIQIRRSRDRGHFNHGWLETFHTFSFGDYIDPKHRGFRVLRVINEDWVLPGQGFPTHAHRDMEILTYILEGALEHRDSMGNTSVIRAGDVQRMSAGSGVEHSEYNASAAETVHLLQIWFFPEKKGLEPSYEQKTFGQEGLKNRLRLILSPDGREGSVSMHQAIQGYDCRLESGKKIKVPLCQDRGAWLQLTEGCVLIEGQMFEAGDGAAMEALPEISIEGVAAESHFVFFDLPDC